MMIVIEHVGSRQLLTDHGDWTTTRERACVCRDALDAIRFCIQQNVREVRLVATDEKTDTEAYLYPFGGDPAAKVEAKLLRKAIRERRRIEREARMTRGKLRKGGTPNVEVHLGVWGRS
jgi:hypothetical protein